MAASGVLNHGLVLGGTFFFTDTHLRPKQLDSEWITVAPGEEKDKK